MKKRTQESYINNYKLTKDEYCLLPEAIRLAYMHNLFGELVGFMGIGEKKELFGYMHPCYFEYFNKCGCSIKNISIDFLNKYIITKTNNAIYLPSDDEINLSREYVEEIAKVRWKTFESALRDKMLIELASLSSHSVDVDFNVSDYEAMLDEEFLTSDLPDKLKNKVMRKQIKTIIGNNAVKINEYLNNDYDDVLMDNGYEVKRVNEGLFVRKLV